MINIVKVISSKIGEQSKRLVKVLRMGDKDVNEVYQSAPHGIESHPVKDRVAIYAKTPVLGDDIVLGYLNRNGSDDIKSGEIKIYSTDENGNEQIYIIMRDDGTMEVGGDSDNMVRYSELKSAFDELKGDFNNFINIFNAHTHTAVTPGNGASGTTASPGSSSSADISGAKIDEIKTI